MSYAAITQGTTGAAVLRLCIDWKMTDIEKEAQSFADQYVTCVYIEPLTDDGKPDFNLEVIEVKPKILA